MNPKYGFTLVEVLIGLLISLTLILFLARIITSSSLSHQLTQAIDESQQNGRFLLQKMRSEMRLAGYYQPLAMTATSTSINLLEEEEFAIRHPILLPGDLPFDGAIGSQVVSEEFDEIVFGFQGFRDCRGFKLGYLSDQTLYVVNRYYVEQHRLYCVGYDGRVLRLQKSAEGHNRHRRVTVLENIYRFNVRFLVVLQDSDTALVSLRYVDANDLNVQPNWVNAIIAVQLGFITFSESTIRYGEGRHIYFMGQSIPLPDDNLYYSAFETTIAMRNGNQTSPRLQQ